MAVLESSVTDLTPAEVTAALRGAGAVLDERTVEARLDKPREWTAVSARTDTRQARPAGQTSPTRPVPGRRCGMWR